MDISEDQSKQGYYCEVEIEYPTTHRVVQYTLAGDGKVQIVGIAFRDAREVARSRVLINQEDVHNNIEDLFDEGRWSSVRIAHGGCFCGCKELSANYAI